MILKTEAICIKNTRYGESSVISKMFTVEHGLSSYIIQGLNRKSSIIRPSHISSGNIVEMVIYQKPNSTLQRVKELKVVMPLIQIHIDMRKNAILQFILEIISKTNEDDLKDIIVYQFLKQSILDLENSKDEIGNVPLLFLCHYLKFSGWFPNLEIGKQGDIFNLNEGRFYKSQLHLTEELSEILSNELHKILLEVQNHSDLKIFKISHKKEIFNILLLYYEIHILKGRKIKSPSILAEVLA
jgi:DNA repair protein RecO (recombination protein O)